MTARAQWQVYFWGQEMPPEALNSGPLQANILCHSQLAENTGKNCLSSCHQVWRGHETVHTWISTNTLSAGVQLPVISQHWQTALDKLLAASELITMLFFKNANINLIWLKNGVSPQPMMTQLTSNALSNCSFDIWNDSNTILSSWHVSAYIRHQYWPRPREFCAKNSEILLVIPDIPCLHLTRCTPVVWIFGASANNSRWRGVFRLSIRPSVRPHGQLLSINTYFMGTSPLFRRSAIRLGVRVRS